MNAQTCRICGDTLPTDPLIDLGIQAIGSRFPHANEPDPPSAPLTLVQCQNCDLVQLQHTVDACEMYTSSYGYRSGLNTSMVQHLHTIVIEMLQYVMHHLREGDIVVDIGSNDATLLSFYESDGNLPKLTLVGIDPTGEQFKTFYSERMRLVSDFFSKEALLQLNLQPKHVKCITSIAMFYDLPDPQKFVNDIAHILDPECGLWILEQSYMPTMLTRNSFDTICHEHLEYYGLKQIQWLCDHACEKLRIVDVSFNEANGGSFRVCICHENAVHKTNTCEIDSILKNEETINKHSFQEFADRCTIQKRRLQMMLKTLKHHDKNVGIYGASTKGNTLLQYYGIDTSLIPVAAERNERKFGCVTPLTRIPIISEDTVRASRPDFLLVLPWHFRDNFLEKEKGYLNDGGSFIYPLPTVEVVSHKKRALITGITGQIGQYLTELLLEKDYIVYGVSRNPEASIDGAIIFTVDESQLLEREIWEDILLTVRPHEVYHLGGETSSLDSIDRPIATYDLNCKWNTILLDVIAQSAELRDTKILSANSVEIFKGTVGDVTISDDYANYRPKTPYGIAKLGAIQMVEFYRNTKKVQCCSAILTNTESPLRSVRYVTQKICSFLKSNDQEVMELGNVDVHRDWIHASDAADAMFLMLQQELLKDCIVASGTNHSIREFLNEAIKQLRNAHMWSWNTLQDGREILTDQKKIIVIRKDVNRAYEGSGYIIYHPKRLHSIGWCATKTMKDIIRDMLHVPMYIAGGRLGDLLHEVYVIYANWRKTKMRGILYITDDPRICTEPFSQGAERTYNDMKRLLMEQPYIHNFLLLKNTDDIPDGIINLSSWRLKNIHCDWITFLSKAYNVPTYNNRWIYTKNMPIVPHMKDKIVIHRNSYYKFRCNPFFPWQKILDKNECIFVSTNSDEHKQAGLVVPFEHAHDLYYKFCCIASSKFFIGNQSSPLAFAWACGKNFLAEINNTDANTYMTERINWYLNESMNHLSGVDRWLQI